MSYIHMRCTLKVAVEKLTGNTLESLYSIIAEHLSARQLIVQCGLKSQLAYIYMTGFAKTRHFPHF